MKGVVKMIIAGAVILGIGIAVLLIALGLNGWTFSPDFTTEEFTSTQENDALDVRLAAGRVKIEYHDGENIQISYPVAKGYETTITESEGTLSIDGNQHKWYIFSCGITFPETVIKIPAGKIKEVSVTLNAGTVEIPDGEFTKVKLNVNAGTINVGNIAGAELFDVDLNAGTVNVSAVTGNKLVCHVSAGTANLKKLDCAETEVKVSAGTANLNFAGAKSDYTATVNVSAGSCNGISTQTGGEKSLTVKVSAGSCNVSFAG